jgi:hypothetical protein
MSWKQLIQNFAWEIGWANDIKIHKGSKVNKKRFSSHMLTELAPLLSTLCGVPFVLPLAYVYIPLAAR